MSKVIVSSLYESDVFKMACRQFDIAADAINLPENIRDRTKYPRRAIAVALPIQRQDGSVTVFEGYRVQHNVSTGPSKGGIRFHQSVTIGEVTIDFASRSASRGGTRVALTAQEFAALGCLVRRRGRIVTRAMLEAAIHPGEAPPPDDLVTNIVDVLVLRLRKKLGHDLITTRRGQGFIVDGE